MSLNKVILIGNLGRDPEVRYMPNGEAVCNFSIATSETWNDRQTGQRQERTEWHNITLYRRLAEVAGQYLKKGSQVYIEGRIQSRKYTGKDGIERTAYEIVCSADGKAAAARLTTKATSLHLNNNTSNSPTRHNSPPTTASRPPRRAAKLRPHLPSPWTISTTTSRSNTQTNHKV